MPAASTAAKRFVRALLPRGEARCEGERVFRVAAGQRIVSLEAGAVAALISAGVLEGDTMACRPAPEAANWVRRQLLGPDAHAAQHRQEVRRADGTLINLAESPLARLAVAAAGEAAPFLEPHQVEAGERLRRLTEKAQLTPRVTMAYDPTRIASGSSSGAAGLGDMAAEARRTLAEIARILPHDCAGVVFDVCGLLKGLQTVESERGWPRRSAKLVLRIGLDQLARYYGLDRAAVGRSQGTAKAWMGEGGRPRMFG